MPRPGARYISRAHSLGFAKKQPHLDRQLGKKSYVRNRISKFTDHQNLAHLGNKNETLAKPQKIFGRPKSGRAGKERPSSATTCTPSTQATLHRRNSEVAIVERMDMDNVRAHPQGRGDANCGRDHKRIQACFALGVGRWHASVMRHGVFASGPRVLVRITAFGGACENLSRQQK